MQTALSHVIALNLMSENKSGKAQRVFLPACVFSDRKEAVFNFLYINVGILFFFFYFKESYH